jgi:hypothetical protein
VLQCHKICETMSKMVKKLSKRCHIVVKKLSKKCSKYVKKMVSFLRNISLALRTFLLLVGWLDSESESATSTVVAVL